MTDKQLITILECCASDENIECCKKCDLCKKYDCYSEISKNVLALINRQKTEIESKTREIERWKNAFMGECMFTCCKVQSELRKEGFKEFAERLKEKADKGFWQTNYYVSIEDIDELVKEMTEVEEDGK